MAWENTSATQPVGRTTQVVAVQNGTERTFTFDNNTPLKTIVAQVASQMGFGSVLVTADGRNVEPNEGDTPISNFGRIEVIPKYSGAAQ